VTVSHRSIQVACTLAAIALALWWGGHEIAPRIVPLVAAVHALGPIAPPFFILLYVVAVVALIPAAWLTVAGGAVFGLLPAVAYGLIGGTLGSTAAFLLGRHGARRVVARYLARMPRLAAVVSAASAQGRRIVFLLRLSPIAPFNFLNYALGLTTITARDFVIASAVGMVPSTFMYAYAGDVAGEALAVAGQAEVSRGASYYAMVAVGLAATIAATTVVSRVARRALRDVSDV
jgi:uncharacterized membrane protein YdjX (TVP38/TMEM64 family)